MTNRDTNVFVTIPQIVLVMVVVFFLVWALLSKKPDVPMQNGEVRRCSHAGQEIKCQCN